MTKRARKKVKRMTITLPEEYVEGLQDFADEINTTVSEAIREAVATFLMEHYWKETVSEVAKEAILDKLPNEDVLKAVKAKFPLAATSMASISWYRSKLRKDHPDLLTDRQANELKKSKD